MQRFDLFPRKDLQTGFCLLAPVIFASSCSTITSKLRPQPSQAEFDARRAAFDAEFPASTTRLPNPNGYDLLVVAAQSIQTGGEGTPDTREKLSPAEDLKRQRAFTAKNAQSLQLVQQGLQLPIAVPPARGAFVKQPPNAKIRTLARLMMQRNRVYAGDKQYGKAIAGALEVVQMGTSIQNGANTIGMLVGVAIQNMGMKDLPLWVAKCDAQTASATVKRMQKQEAQMTQFRSVTPEMKWDNLESLKFTLTNPNWNEEGGMSQLVRWPHERQQLKNFSERQVLSNYITTMDKAIAHAKLPFDHNAPIVPPAADPLSAYFSSFYTDTPGKQNTLRHSTRWTRTFTLHRLLQTAFAVQAFQQTSGQYPANLNVLVGKYLQEVPRDPFAPESALNYQSNGKTFTLYSVGPDTVDNKGAAIKENKIDVETRGDIVYGFGALSDGRA